MILKAFLCFPMFYRKKWHMLVKDLGAQKRVDWLCFRNEVLHVLRNTPKNRANLAEGSVGDDRRGNQRKGGFIIRESWSSFDRPL